MLKEELREILKYVETGNFFKLKEIESPYDAFVIKRDNWRGVAIPINNYDVIESNYYAKFEKIKVCINKIFMDNKEIYTLELLTNGKNLFDQFALICLDFIEPGENGINRDLIINTPEKWVGKWKELLGNKIKNDTLYSYLGELLILKHLLKREISARITKQGTYDIESEGNAYEVKTTVMRYSSEIEIHSQYQLIHDKNQQLKLYFVRLEESITGVSLNSIIEDLRMMNCKDIDEIENRVSEVSSDIRIKKYNVLEVREYNIDEEFPKITAKSFKEDKLPQNIIGFTYRIDLDGIEYKNIEVESIVC